MVYTTGTCKLHFVQFESHCTKLYSAHPSASSCIYSRTHTYMYINNFTYTFCAVFIFDERQWKWTSVYTRNLILLFVRCQCVFIFGFWFFRSFFYFNLNFVQHFVEWTIWRPCNISWWHYCRLEIRTTRYEVVAFFEIIDWQWPT